MVVGGQVYVDKHGTVRALRPVEKLLLRYHTEVDGSNFVTKAVIDRRPAVHDVARYGIGLTTIVLVVLILGSLAFIADVDRLVILPIETMVKLVQKIADDPLRVDYSVSDNNSRCLLGFVCQHLTAFGDTFVRRTKMQESKKDSKKAWKRASCWRRSTRSAA